MPTSKEYREFSAQCRVFADRTSSIEQREILLRMAETWMKLAETLEAEEQNAKNLAQGLPDGG